MKFHCAVSVKVTSVTHESPLTRHARDDTCVADTTFIRILIQIMSARAGPALISTR